MANQTSLSGYYQSQGKQMPSLQERAKSFESSGLGPSASYTGTAEQNNALLQKLQTPRPVALPVTKQAPPADQRLIDLLKKAWDKLKTAFEPKSVTPVQLCPLSSQNALTKPVLTKNELDLGPNEIYREEILTASRRTGTEPAAIAALINAEAARDPKTGVWKADSYNEGSGARGLTQFLCSTWGDRALVKGSLLNERAKEMGYIDSNNRIVDKTALLELRNDPELSIVSAAEYGQENLRKLSEKGLVPIDATDDQKAKLMYIAHHEGPGGAAQVLSGTLTDERARKLFPQQVGQDKADKLIAANNDDAAGAYTKWLNGYTDQMVQPAKYRI